MTTVADRLTALEAALLAAPPPGEAGGPATRIKADYGAKSKSSGRKVASKAGEKRYGLPIGTPLGQTKSKAKADPNTQRSYDTFMAAQTPADLNKAAGWMSSDDLGRAGEALFSFDSKNERDQAARLALVKELAARGIDPHTYGYKGGPVVLNPNPKPDPVAKAAGKVAKAAQTAQKQDQAAQQKAAAAQKTADTAAQRAAQQAQAQATRDTRNAAQAAKVAQQTEAAKVLTDTRKKLAQDIAAGRISQTEAQKKLAGKV